MKLAGWYKILLVAWLCLGLPGLVIGYGMSGGTISAPDPRFTTAVGFLIWAIVWAFLVSPLLAAPWGIKGIRRSFRGKDNRDEYL